MDELSEHAFALKTRKIWKRALVASFVVILGIVALFALDSVQVTEPFMAKVLKPGVALISALAGVSLVIVYRQLRKAHRAVVFNVDGVITTLGAAGFIPWSEIEDFSSRKVSGHFYLVIHLRDPEQFLGKGSAFQRMVAGQSLKIFGFPLVIATALLETNIDDLLVTAQEYLDKYAVDHKRSK